MLRIERPDKIQLKGRSLRDRAKHALAPVLRWAMRYSSLKRTGAHLLAAHPGLKARLLRLAREPARTPAEIIAERAQQPALFGRVCGYDCNDLRVFENFPPYEGAGTPGHVTDFLGNRTAVAFVGRIEHLDGTV